MGGALGTDRRFADPTVDERIERILAGDAAAKRWLFDTFSARLLRRLRRRYSRLSGVDPEDLLHDAYLACFDGRGRVLGHFLEHVPPSERSESRLEAYMWGVACGIASNRRRSARRRNHIDPALLPPPAAGEDPEREFVDRDALDGLRGCLKRTGSRVYLYFKLRFVDGLTPAEIARATRWSRKATYKLKMSLNEAVERCAERLGLV